MRAYTIVVHPAPEEERHIVTVPDLPGWVGEGGTVEECVARAREVIGVFDEDLTLARSAPAAGPPPAGGPPAADEASEEAVDALRRAMAALRTVEADLEDEFTRRPDRRDHPLLRRAHVAVLRARCSLGEEERRAAEPGG